jgi:hypothetical protein
MDVECSDLSNWVFVGVEGCVFSNLISVALKALFVRLECMK